jgi:copper chaperone
LTRLGSESEACRPTRRGGAGGARALAHGIPLRGIRGRSEKGVEFGDTITYSVPGIHCGHCEAAIKQEVGSVAGVELVEVDLEGKEVTVRGEALDDAQLRAAIDEAGYDVA